MERQKIAQSREMLKSREARVLGNNIEQIKMNKKNTFKSKQTDNFNLEDIDSDE